MKKISLIRYLHWHYWKIVSHFLSCCSTQIKGISRRKEKTDEFQIWIFAESVALVSSKEWLIVTNKNFFLPPLNWFKLATGLFKTFWRQHLIQTKCMHLCTEMASIFSLQFSFIWFALSFIFLCDLVAISCQSKYFLRI